MKRIACFTLLFSFSFFSLSQEVFEYEKKIDDTLKYNFFELKVLNKKSGFELQGTLICPKSFYEKIALIVPGSGKDTRNSHFFLAENLLKNNFAVFRFDERGVGKSGGKYSELALDISEDLNYFLKYIKTIYHEKKIGIIGHSIGGIAALESIQNGFVFDFIILIETPIKKNGNFILNQLEADYENNLPYKIRKNKSKEEVIMFLNDLFELVIKNESKKNIKEFIRDKGFNQKFIYILDDVFLIEMLHLDLESTVNAINIPFLYLTGNQDKIINSKAEVDLMNSFNKNNFTIKIYNELNHWLTKKNSANGTSLYLMDDEPMNDIINWMINI